MTSIGVVGATGQVGVAIATSGPGATNMVTGIATAMMDSSRIVCITGQVGSKAIGSDAFQETDITGITLPITKHNYLVTKAEEIATTIREAFFIARSGRPGPVLVDITKDAQQALADFVWDDGQVKLPGYRPRFRPAEEDLQRAVELINEAQRPLIFAGNGIVKSGAGAPTGSGSTRAGPVTTATVRGARARAGRRAPSRGPRPRGRRARPAP